jgi:hypothetical protein
MQIVSESIQNYQNGSVTTQLTNIRRGVLGVAVNLLMCNQGVTKRCCLSLLTNSALVYKSQCVGMGGGGVWGLRGLSQ